MTFLHKLAKRLAGVPAIVTTLVLLGSCSTGSVQDYLGPDPGNSNFVSISISPRDPHIAVGDSVRLDALGWLSSGKTSAIAVTWSVSGGSISQTGWFRPDGVGDFLVRAVATAKPSLSDSTRVASFNQLGGIVRLEVLPALTAVPKGASQQFVAQAVMQDGLTTLPTVAWSATGGTITSTGLFTASGNVGTVSVSATLGAGMASAQSDVAIQPAVLTQLILDPSAVIMEAGETRQLTVAASWSDGGSTLPPIVWAIQGGTLNGQNVFTAGATPGMFRLVVASPTFAKADTSLVWILPKLVGLRLAPATASLAPGGLLPIQAFAVRNDGSETAAGVQWTATGGSIAVDGKYRAGTTPGQYRVVGTLHSLSGEAFVDTARMAITNGSGTLTQMSVLPHTPTVTVGNSLQFTVSGFWSDGTSAVPAVTWAVTGGSIDQTGFFTAPQTPGTYQVIATQFGGSRADTAVVTTVAKLTGFRIQPKVDTMVVGQTRQFSATLNWSDGQTHPVTITWNTTGGVISPTGVYSPGTLVGSILVVATCSCGAADTAAVTVRSLDPPASPVLMSLALTPHAVALALGGIQQFSANGTWNNGSTGAVGVLYSATCGSVSTSGFYLADTVPGTCRVIALQQGGTRADTAVVTVNPGHTLNQVFLNPAVVTVAPGASQQFSVSGSWSDGVASAPDVVYSATGGSIDANGVFTSGQTPGTFAVIATQQGGSLADTSVVTITPAPGPVLTQLVMNPSAVTVLPGATQQFSVAASWSDGSSTLPPLTFTATGGTVTAGGLFTAGAAAGVYQVIVKHQGGTRADTSTVNIPQLTAMTMNPASVSLTAGGAQLFSVSGTWSNGLTIPPAVTYTATGGTISPAGLYTAGSSTGSYRVIARQASGTLADTSAVTISAAAPPPPPAPGDPALPALLNTQYSAPTGNTINVPAGGNFQNALNNAACGDEILLAPGATYTGNFVLPTRQCSTRPIHVRTAGALPPEGVRVTTAVAAGFAKLVSATTDAALKAAPQARGWRIMAVEITVTPALSLSYGILRIGEGTEMTLGEMPGNVVIDRAYVHGNAAGNIQRCIALNGDSTAVIDSWVSDCHAKGFDSQAAGGWAGPGPFKIVNNFLEGAGENIIFGGADPRINGLTPSDIEIRRNHIYKPLTWLATNAWTVKTLLELKNARRVLVEGNVLENNWMNAQVGYGILFQAISDNPAITWTTVQDVTVRYNQMIASGSGINLLGTAHSYETPMARISFTDNVLKDIGRPDLLSEGKLLQILGGAGGIHGLTIAHNTLLHSTVSGTQVGAAILLDANVGGSIRDLVMLNNIFSVGATGLYGNEVGVGTAALNRYASPWDFRGNALAGETSGSVYPAANFFPVSVASLNLDAEKRIGITLNGTDGRTVGADISALLTFASGVTP